MAKSESVSIRELPQYFRFFQRSTRREQYKGTFHAHRGIEIFFVHEGRGTMILGQKTYEVVPGMICIFQPFELHHIQMDLSEEVPYVRSVIHFEPAFLQPYLKSWPALEAFFRDLHVNRLHSPCLYGLHGHPVLTGLFEDMKRRLADVGANERNEEISLFLVSFLRILKELWQEQHLPTSDGSARRIKPVEEILQWIEQHYKEPFRLDHLAKELHLSPYYLSHLFKACTGASISDYVGTRRIHEAVLLLTSTDQPVSQIAEAIGIANPSYFCKFFRERTGVTPYRYKKDWEKRRY